MAAGNEKSRPFGFLGNVATNRAGNGRLPHREPRQAHRSFVSKILTDVKEAYTNNTLTATITSIIQTACGFDSRPKEHIVDIDAIDAANEFAAVEYVEDIYYFYKLVEHESFIPDYIHSQPEITERMRAVLIDWVIDIHNRFKLETETLYLAVNIVDRYLAVQKVPRKKLQLVGISALLIASKYEELWAPSVNDLLCISERAYYRREVLQMEKSILESLKWSITVPTTYMFLVRFIKASASDSKVEILENLVYFLSELAIMNYATILYPPSLIAASAVYVARSTLDVIPVWNATLHLHTGFNELQLMDCAKLLVEYHTAAPSHTLNVIYRKYSSCARGSVSLITPATALLDW